MRRGLLGALALLLACAWPVQALEPLTTTSMDPPPNFRIGVLQVTDIEPYQQAYDGFLKALREQGIVAGRNLTVERIKIDFDVENGGMWDRFLTLLRIREAANRLADSKPDLVLTIGTPATKYAKGILAEAHVPVVFTAVANPVDAGCPSLTDGGPGVTGATLYTDMGASLRVVRQLLPAVQRIGMVYTDDENAVAHVQAAQAAAPALGMSVSSVQVNKTDPIIPALKTLLEPGRDAQLYAVPLDTYYGLRRYEPAKDLGDFSVENGIPVVALALVRMPGAVLYVGADFANVGGYAGSQAAKILQRRVRPDLLPVLRQSQPTVLIDPKRAEALHVTVPPAWLEHKIEIANGFWQIRPAPG
jgi:putative ABC transport system substrate-binding protein